MKTKTSQGQPCIPISVLCVENYTLYMVLTNWSYINIIKMCKHINTVLDMSWILFDLKIIWNSKYQSHIESLKITQLIFKIRYNI